MTTKYRVVWQWHGGQVYGNNLGGGSEPSLGTVLINDEEVKGVMLRWSYPFDFSLMLGDYPNEVYIDIPARTQEPAQKKAEPYIVGYWLGRRDLETKE